VLDFLNLVPGGSQRPALQPSREQTSV